MRTCGCRCWGPGTDVAMTRLRTWRSAPRSERSTRRSPTLQEGAVPEAKWERGNVFLSLKGPCKMLVNQRDQSPRKHHVSLCRFLHEIVKLSWRHKFLHLSQYDKMLFHHVLVRCQHRILRKPWLRQLHQVG